MTRILFILLALFIIHDDTQAQYAYFATQGKISFEKITYTRARMRDLMANMDTDNTGRRQGVGGMRMGGNLDNIPESSTQYFELTFDEKQSLMMPVEDNSTQTGGGPSGRVTTGFSGGRSPGGNRGQGNNRMTMTMRRAGGNNKVLYQNLKDQTAEIQVEIDEKYILSDSLSPITWRFTDEYRTIAGYECRRVNGATPDSLYLIAYYTDQIPVSAGPALSHGLPGMIMGLVIPEMHIHYWATKITYSNDPVPTNWKEKKIKSMTLPEFSDSFGRFFSRGREDNNTSNKRLILEQLIY
ncbi:GLPGLI family protein [Sphingobacterium lumbrici]|uniref:GLPGLI family protein n=1 Tax=Sphingobacterium lumbrici TaxID=2559600 RepID=UPI00112A58E8|nr:GLPGLI family protein [Sphingobacterium lumbrici]